MGFSTLLLFSFSATLLSIATLTLALDDVYFEHNCSTTKDNYTANSAYQTNLNRLVSQLSTLTKFNYGFYNLSAVAGRTAQDNVYLTALCRGDQTQIKCNKCLNYTASELKQFCPWNKEATAWSQYCQVRYSDQTTYGQLINDPRTCVYNTKDASNPQQFNDALNELLLKLSIKAASGGALRKYAADNTTVGNLQQKIYAMVQCSPDMDQRNCSACLNFAMKELTNCCSGKLGCRVLRPTCFLRFEADWQFYGTPVPLPSRPSPPKRSCPPRANINLKE